MKRKKFGIFMVMVSLFVLACAANQAYTQSLPEVSADDLKIVQLQVIGCTWATTGERVRSVLLEIDGVVEAIINYTLQTATVTFDPAKANVDDMIWALENEGSGEFHVTGHKFLN